MKVSRKVFTVLIMSATLMFVGCSDDKPEPPVNPPEEKPPTIEYPPEHVVEEEIKVGSTPTKIVGEGHSFTFDIYILRSSVKIDSRNPYRFTCKVCLIDQSKTSSIDGPVYVRINEKDCDDYMFFPKDAPKNLEPYFVWVSGNNKPRPVKGDAVASRVYDYVTKNSDQFDNNR